MHRPVIRRFAMNLKNMILYAGTDRESYIKVKDSIMQENLRVLFPFSILLSLTMACMTVASLLEPTLSVFRPAYVGTCIGGLVILLITLFPAKRNQGWVYVAEYLFIMILLAFGISLGTVFDPTQATVSFAILLFAVPLVFTDTPWRTGICIIASIIIYGVAASITQTPQLFSYNMASIIPYGTVGVVVSTYMMSIKVSKQVLEMRNRFLSESDQLTGLLNRNSYEDHLAKIRESKEKKTYTICTFDINGLKLVNDKLGHQAGDELIKGAADCISGEFKAYGKVYRVGGDEFMVIIEGEAPASEEMWVHFEKRARCWNGTMVSGLSASMGVAVSEPGENIDDVIRRADKIMYSYKDNYYKTNGKERRDH